MAVMTTLVHSPVINTQAHISLQVAVLCSLNILMLSHILVLFTCPHSLQSFLEAFYNTHKQMIKSLPCKKRDMVVRKYFLTKLRYISNFLLLLIEIFLAFGFIVDLYDGAISEKPLILYLAQFTFFLALSIYFYEEASTPTICDKPFKQIKDDEQR